MDVNGLRCTVRLNMEMIKLMDKMLHSTFSNTLMTVVCLYILLTDAANYVNCTKEKRQLFREHVLPEKGGKIPEAAFHPERLVLNRLNQQGISVLDGIILDQRRQEKHPFPKQHLPETLKVVLMNDGRYIAPPGRYHYDKPPTVGTTYVIRMPYKDIHKGISISQWSIASKVPPMNYYKYVDVTKWIPPTWYKEISNSMLKTKHNQDIIDPSQVLAEYSSYLQKLHRDYDK